MKDTIIYEYPLNEAIRVCLRLEQLFQQIDHQLDDLSVVGTRNLVSDIIDVLHILDRPDLKAKLAKEMSGLQANLQRYGNQPDVNAEKLTTFTNQLDELARSLIDSSGKIAHRLRDIELLNHLRTHLATPGGACSFDSPIFHYWLQQSVETRRQTLNEWLSDFDQIRNAVTLVLDLVRNNSKVVEKTAVHGFHQELLDPQSNLRMIRIGIARQTPAYPEISIGRHFFSVRFFFPYIEKRPTQYTENLHFWVAYCNA